LWSENPSALYEEATQRRWNVQTDILWHTLGAPAAGPRIGAVPAVYRILSTFASPLSEADKMSKLKPVYQQRVDAALANAPDILILGGCSSLRRRFMLIRLEN
jgi:hypothetical protein